MRVRQNGPAVSLPTLRLQRVTRKDILFFTEELATLVRAGLPLDRSLSITRELAPKQVLREVIDDLLKQIKGGKSLAEALAAHPKQFSRLHVSMIRAGEAGGVLDVILDRLAEFERSADELRSYLIASLVYPILLTLVGLGSFGILFYFVIPRFATIFDDVGAEMPTSTLALLTMSNLTRDYWWAILAGLAFDGSGNAGLAADGERDGGCGISSSSGCRCSVRRCSKLK